MSKLPRASLCITLLDDEDYRVLMASKNGLESFGVFVAMLVLGRERLQQEKARQVSGSESLKFDNSTTHLLAMTHVSHKQLVTCLKTLSQVAKDTGSEPWMYLDETSHLVIRSFFKFNLNAGWGGVRPGAGRQSRGNQDDSKNNQDDSESNSSRILSSTDSITHTVTDSVPTPKPPDGGAGGNGEIVEPIEPGGEPVSRPPRIQNDPADIDRVSATAEQLFPSLDYGIKVRQLAAVYDVNVLEAAFVDAHHSRKSEWHYINGIYNRRIKQPDGALPSRPNGRASPAASQPRKQTYLSPEDRAKLPDH